MKLFKRTLFAAAALAVMGCAADTAGTASTAKAAASEADKELMSAAQGIFKPLPTFEEMQKVRQVTPEQIKLGQALFYDPRLSADQQQSCNTCHNLATYGVDNQSFSKGVAGGFGGRNAPSVLNSSLFVAQFWDGRRRTKNLTKPTNTSVNVRKAASTVMVGFCRVSATRRIPISCVTMAASGMQIS